MDALLGWLIWVGLALMVLGLPFFALTKAQRLWTLRRDKFRCQQFTYNPKTGKWEQCRSSGTPEKNTNLHVHHRVPSRWARKHIPNMQPDSPTNLITLCAPHHVNRSDSVHPDTAEARDKYRKGNKNAYNEMVENRNKLVDEGKPYWDTKDDWQYERRAKKNTARYSRKEKFPRRKKK